MTKAIHIDLVMTTFGWDFLSADDDSPIVATIPVIFDGNIIGTAHIYSWFADNHPAPDYSGLAVDLKRLTGATKGFDDTDYFLVGKIRCRNGLPGDILDSNKGRFAKRDPRPRRRRRVA